MSNYSLSHLADRDLSSKLHTLVARDRALTAALLAHLAEFESRRLFAPAGYSSMRDYCVRKLGFSEQVAFKRIRAARMARRFPVLFEAVADGRLHLSAVVLLKPYLGPDTIQDLVAAAAHKTRAEVEQMLAERFPSHDAPTMLEPVAEPASQQQPAPQGADGLAEQSSLVQESSCQLSPGTVAPRANSKVAALAPERFALQVTIGQRTYEKLRRAQELLSHQLPAGDLAEVLDRALETLVRQLEKRKFAATDKPRRGAQRTSADPRHIPAHVQREVATRDGHQCTFVSNSGHRCEARHLLQYDHIEPVARGGKATVANLCLRCRTHNIEGSFRHGVVRMSWGEAPSSARHAGKNLLN